MAMAAGSRNGLHIHLYIIYVRIYPSSIFLNSGEGFLGGESRSGMSLRSSSDGEARTWLRG